MFKDRILLITGGTGSFGNVVVKQFLDTDIKEIRIFSRDEKKQDDMRKLYGNDKLKFYIGDVRDLSSIKDAMNDVDYVFHAAALKQVPCGEVFPMQVVKTNIIGTDNVLTAAIEAGVKKVVCLSTDKAVYPVNAMGISKAMMEKIFIAKSEIANARNMIICGTRYGNILGSRGSVVPLFIEQIKKGLPITVTAPEMTRFFMDLDEAKDLVLFAFENGAAGDILVQKAKAATIVDLAQALKEIFNVNNPINIIGARKGDKFYETLYTEKEASNALDLGKFMKIQTSSKCNSMARAYTSQDAEQLNVEALKQVLLKTEYVQQELKEWKR